MVSLGSAALLTHSMCDSCSQRRRKLHPLARPVQCTLPLGSQLTRRRNWQATTSGRPSTMSSPSCPSSCLRCSRGWPTSTSWLRWALQSHTAWANFQGTVPWQSGVFEAGGSPQLVCLCVSGRVSGIVQAGRVLNRLLVHGHVMLCNVRLACRLCGIEAWHRGRRKPLPEAHVFCVSSVSNSPATCRWAGTA